MNRFRWYLSGLLILSVKVLCEVERHVVAAREKNMLATSFHPELTGNAAFHQYFIGMCSGK